MRTLTLFSAQPLRILDANPDERLDCRRGRMYFRCDCTDSAVTLRVTNATISQPLESDSLNNRNRQFSDTKAGRNQSEQHPDVLDFE